MILVLGITFALLWLKEVITSDKFEHGACKAPHVSRFVVLSTEAYLWGTVLPSLNNIRELIIDVTCISHIHKLYSKLQRNDSLKIIFIEGLNCLIAHFI